jgi:beta-N-acetylhexosaminidase
VIRRLLAVAALVLGGAVATAGTSDRSSRVDELTLEQRVGQLLVLSFKGTVVPAYVLDALREQRVAGVILFRGNITGPRQLRTLTRSLRGAWSDTIVAVDQEGGDIRTISWVPPLRSEPEQAAAGTVRRDAEAAGRALHSLGVTVSLAPVGDVPSVPRAALAARAFSADPTQVSRAMTASVRGWRAGGVASTAKHFPGLGGARRNTDRAEVTILRTRPELETVDLRPFAAAVRAGVPLVMVGHARYPALDRARIASQSSTIVEDVLRGELGFRGVVITDSMEAKASLATGSITAVSERAVRAGADLVLLTGRGSYEPVYRHLLAVARRSEAFRARVRESAARVLALKAT